MSRLFPKPMKDEGQPDDLEGAWRVDGSCQPWCRWSDRSPNYPHPPKCESLSFTNHYSVKAYSSRRKDRRVAVMLAERNLEGLHSKKVLEEGEPTWVHLETMYVDKRAERSFDVYLRPGEALRLAAAIHAAALAADGLDETITQRVRDWRARYRPQLRPADRAASA